MPPLRALGLPGYSAQRFWGSEQPFENSSENSSDSVVEFQALTQTWPGSIAPCYAPSQEVPVPGCVLLSGPLGDGALRPGSR